MRRSPRYSTSHVMGAGLSGDGANVLWCAGALARAPACVRPAGASTQHRASEVDGLDHDPASGLVAEIMRTSACSRAATCSRKARVWQVVRSLFERITGDAVLANLEAVREIFCQPAATPISASRRVVGPSNISSNAWIRSRSDVHV
jgi:hypothetical protein